MMENDGLFEYEIMMNCLNKCLDWNIINDEVFEYQFKFIFSVIGD